MALQLGESMPSSAEKRVVVVEYVVELKIG
jgi:hypothetical protein